MSQVNPVEYFFSPHFMGLVVACPTESAFIMKLSIVTGLLTAKLIWKSAGEAKVYDVIVAEAHGHEVNGIKSMLPRAALRVLNSA